MNLFRYKLTENLRSMKTYSSQPIQLNLSCFFPDSQPVVRATYTITDTNIVTAHFLCLHDVPANSFTLTRRFDAEPSPVLKAKEWLASMLNNCPSFAEINIVTKLI